VWQQVRRTWQGSLLVICYGATWTPWQGCGTQPESQDCGTDSAAAAVDAAEYFHT